jgi:hypothetical protein
MTGIGVTLLYQIVGSFLSESPGSQKMIVGVHGGAV